MGLEELEGKELPTLNTKILVEAEAFYRIGIQAFKEMEEAVTQNGELLQKVSLFPAIVNTAFACELYMKNLLHEREGIVIEHHLDTLFEKLDETVKRVIKETIVSNKKGYTDEIFNENLKNISNVFVDWRYYYESNKAKPVNLEFLKIFAHALHAFIVLYN